jgi:hypothetical protein
MIQAAHHTEKGPAFYRLSSHSNAQHLQLSNKALPHLLSRRCLSEDEERPARISPTFPLSGFTREAEFQVAPDSVGFQGNMIGPT